MLFIFRNDGKTTDTASDSPPPPNYSEVMKDGNNGGTNSPKLTAKVWKRTKKTLQSNKVTQPFCPPSGEVATTLTLSLTIIAIFLSARAVLGPIAGN